MDLALIPPYSLLEWMDKTRIQMILPACLTDSREYEEAVYQLRRDSTKLFILDNGLYEGEALPWGKLATTAVKLGADELVLPDMFNEYLATERLVRAALAQQAYLPDIKLMAVLQGQSVQELHFLVGQYANMSKITTIGIPKVLVGKVGRKQIRLDMATLIDRDWPRRFEIHLLGGSPLWPFEIKHAAQMGIIRSMDTSMPFVYAAAGYSVRSATFVERQPDYFRLGRESFYPSGPIVPRQLVDDNVDLMLRWAGCEDV